MKFNNVLFFLTLGLILASCGENPTPPTPTTFTVTWTNYDDSILKVDNNVSFGVIPSYTGDTPTKPHEGNTFYRFSTWTPNIQAVDKDITYKAVFESYSQEIIPGQVPEVSIDGKMVTYGLYPQAHVSDASLIEQLEKIQPSALNGWYLYNSNYYKKITADVYNNETYTFDDGTSITSGNDYWFKCEPIVWNVLNKNNSEYFLISNVLLDVCSFDTESNNYQTSDVRNFLNDNFYNTAFALYKDPIKTINVDNSSTTTDNDSNPYICDDTQDKVYLLSYKDYINTEYGFDSDTNKSSKTRERKTSDYARAIGAWCSKEKTYANNGAYLTRSPSSEFSYAVSTIDSSGFISNYPVDSSSQCIRAAITIKIV